MFLIEALPLSATSLGSLLTGATLALEMSLFYHLYQQLFRNLQHLLDDPNIEVVLSATIWLVDRYSTISITLSSTPTGSTIYSLSLGLVSGK